MGEIVWLKLTDPDAELPVTPPDTDVRVLLPVGREFEDLRNKLSANGIEWREVPYLIEDEMITGHDGAGAGGCMVVASECSLLRSPPRQFPVLSGPAATAARDTYNLLWQTYEPARESELASLPPREAVPEAWLRFLPHEVFNPAQAAAIPLVQDHEGHLVVVAPTGAGKTVIGMAAALRTILGEGQKAAWLVPQRSLTDELDRDLEAWRREGLRVERLSGEHSVDVGKVREADLWVATTEKFEAMCRASSLREALAEVGCLIVDEIHLLGDPERGPVLEALLARMRGRDSGMRILGLSATVSNAEQIADWLGARLLRLTWRPSRLTWQTPTIAAHRDWSLVETARIRLASAITATITRDGGSVLVFCGSKRNVRRTALIIAGARGADINGIHPNNTERLHEACRSAGIGLHYKGWEHRKQAEEDFRARRLDVLVATTTVAAGVNLPARAVIVQDTEVGLNPIDVATVQQMFGRAGRVGAGEHSGWAFLIVTEHERPGWQAKLAVGHTVRSQIEASLPDHVLAEAVQNGIRTSAEAEQWWVGTLAHHQGNRSLAPLRQALDFLADARLLTRKGEPGGEARLVPTELGKLTARLMVPATTGHELRLALAEAPLPDSPEEAEEILIGLVSVLVPKLAQTAINEELKADISRFLRPDGVGEYQPGDLARAALHLAAEKPWAFHRSARTIEGIPYMALYPVLEEAPRYLHWIGCQGLLGTVHPWAAIVAADLSKRVRWRRCQPTRGAGRLLWMCEQMATPAHLEQLVPHLWEAATRKGFTSPDWTSRGKPGQCRLGDEDYQALLRDRATDVTIELHDNHATADGPEASTLTAWRGTRFTRVTIAHRQGVASFPEGGGDPAASVFTWRGDYQATGWLSQYTRIERHPRRVVDDSPAG